MKTLFGSELLEKGTSKFIIQLGGYLEDKNITRINVQAVTIVDDRSHKLMRTTTIVFQDCSKVGQFANVPKWYTLTVSHAKDMSCSNWQLSRVRSQREEAYEDKSNKGPYVFEKNGELILTYESIDLEDDGNYIANWSYNDAATIAEQIDKILDSKGMKIKK